MEQTQAIEYITFGRERRSLEYKQSVSWRNRSAQDRLTKSILGMANLRQGVVIVIGVEQQGATFAPTGMRSEDSTSFTQDGVSSYVAEYASPYIECTVSQCFYEDKPFIIIEVAEFEELPIVCKRDGTEGLRRGAIYTRSHRMNETAQVSSEAEMREIIELAVDKGIERELDRFRRLGLLVLPTIQREDADRQSLDDQLQGL